MNGGDSDTELLLLRRAEGTDTYEPFQTLPAPGGEDAEFFRIGERAFLAVADIRSGKGPYEYTTDSTVFEWDGTQFTPFQSILGFAAKQWRHFAIGERHFLALAQGVTVPGHEQENQPSRIYTWDGTRFAALQDVDALWGYNWHAFELGGEHFLAYADHVRPSVLLRWNGEKFEHVQDLAPQHGRAFAHFTDARGETYLLVACLASPSRLLRWDGERFVEHQVLDGLGAREFAVLDTEHGLYVVRVNFILGTQAEPVTALDSELYRFAEGRLTPCSPSRPRAPPTPPCSAATTAACWSPSATASPPTSASPPGPSCTASTSRALPTPSRKDPPMPSYQSPELVDLFTTYTAGPGSIGSHLTRAAVERGSADPLIVATSADFALYPGDGRPPTVEGFRYSTRGFKELAGVSHLGPAVATLVQLRMRSTPTSAGAPRPSGCCARSSAPAPPTAPSCGARPSPWRRTGAASRRSPTWSTTRARSPPAICAPPWPTSRTSTPVPCARITWKAAPAANCPSRSTR
jgi:hypothetical protein